MLSAVSPVLTGAAPIEVPTRGHHELPATRQRHFPHAGILQHPSVPNPSPERHLRGHRAILRRGLQRCDRSSRLALRRERPIHGKRAACHRSACASRRIASAFVHSPFYCRRQLILNIAWARETTAQPLAHVNRGEVNRPAAGRGHRADPGPCVKARRRRPAQPAWP